MAVELSEAEKLEEARASVLRVTKEINAATIDRDTEVRLGILALVSREHMLMLGPPGTAKTLVANYLGRTTESGKFFEILLSKFTTPDEVFGPVSVKELISKERHFRKTDGYLPWAETVMLDEALAIDTPIPTPTGWTAMGDLKAGDYVLGADGKPTKVVRTTAIVPGDCYRVTFNDKTEITADAGHLWKARCGSRVEPGEWRIIDTREMFDLARQRQAEGYVEVPRCASGEEGCMRIASVEPALSVPVRCIEVAAEDHLFLAGTACVATHNCFKGSSAILNTLLTAINERKFDNGGERVPIPLGSIFGASNELPQDDVLAALYDRFLIRTEVQPVSNPLRLLDVDRLPKPKSKLLHLNALRAAVPKVTLPTNVRQAAASIKSLAEAAGAKVGDRRFRLSANLIRASAAISGRTTASANDLWPLSYCYWTTPDQIPTITRATRTAMDQAGAQHEASETAPYEDPGPSPSAASGPSSGANTAYQGLVSALRADPSTRAKMLAATASAIRSSTPDAIKADAKLCVQIRALAETAPPANKKVRPNASDPDHLVKLMAGRI